MAKFRKRPVVVEAFQYTGDAAAVARHFTDMSYSTMNGVFKIFTLEGEHIASVGDWIIEGVKGEHYPCKPDIFAATYEEA